MINIYLNYVKASLRCRKAQTFVEYALLLAFIFVIAYFLHQNMGIDANGRPELHSLSLKVRNTFNYISNMTNTELSSM